jgi:hypothetical protein
LFDAGEPKGGSQQRVVSIELARDKFNESLQTRPQPALDVQLGRKFNRSCRSAAHKIRQVTFKLRTIDLQYKMTTVGIPAHAHFKRRRSYSARRVRAYYLTTTNLNLTAAMRNEVDEEKGRNFAGINADLTPIGNVAERQIADTYNVLTHTEPAVRLRASQLVLTKNPCNPLASLLEIVSLGQKMPRQW